MQANERVKPLKESLDHVDHLQENLFHNSENAKGNLHREFEKLREKLSLAEEEMMLDINKETQRKAFQLKRQEEELKLNIEKFATASSFLNKTVAFASDVEVTLIRKVIQDRMKCLGDIHIDTIPQCNDKISNEDLKVKLEAILKE